MKPRYLDWLIKKLEVTTDEGKKVDVYELDIKNDENVLNEWALHFRRQYCTDNDLNLLSHVMGKTSEEILRDIKFPSRIDRPGPATRSGDFAELLIADYLEFLLGYFVPRTRYDRRTNPDISTSGSDVVGVKCAGKISASDELIIFEVKCTASETRPSKKARLQDAIDDSCNDKIRLAETLAAMFIRYNDLNQADNAKRIARFLNPADSPYKSIFAAAAVQSSTNYNQDLLKKVITSHHSDPNVLLMVVKADKLMSFITDMYERASKC